jgi:hypothetical protein
MKAKKAERKDDESNQDEPETVAADTPVEW